jgi:hypothetical protein
MYQLFPPIFIVPEETNFPDSWEVFCCKLLNLENNTSSIVRRLPPENGVDLFFSESKIAYQCKSVETGLTSGFNLTKIKASYDYALTIKSSLGWIKYVVCINTELTGTQEENLKKELPDVTILTKSYWTTLCQKFQSAVQENFRRIISIHPQQVEQKIQNGFYNNYSSHLKTLLHSNSFDLLFYSNRHNTVYRIPVAKEFKISDLLHILRGIFNLPPETEFSGGVKVSISYSIVYNDKPIILSQTIGEAGIDKNSIITFWLKISYRQDSQLASSTTMQMMTVETMNRAMNPVQYALDEYKDLISKCFINVDKHLQQVENDTSSNEKRANR